MGNKAFRRKLKRYQHDKRVQDSLKKLTEFVEGEDQIPQVSDYPNELNVHLLNRDKQFEPRTLFAHLKGQKITTVFRVDEPKKIDFIGIGTHQDFGYR